MADLAHIAELRKGVAAWNAWRTKNPDIRPDLCNADLSGADILRGRQRGEPFEANLSGTNLVEAYLSYAAELITADATPPRRCSDHDP